MIVAIEQLDHGGLVHHGVAGLDDFWLRPGEWFFWWGCRLIIFTDKFTEQVYGDSAVIAAGRQPGFPMKLTT